MTEHPELDPRPEADNPPGATPDPNMIHWVMHTEPPSEMPTMPVPYWSVAHEEFYFGVIRIHGDHYGWFIGQGRDGDRDLDPLTLAHGEEPTALLARNEVAAWWNEHRNSIAPRVSS
jgi:hypothetical protein